MKLQRIGENTLVSTQNEGKQVILIIEIVRASIYYANMPVLLEFIEAFLIH